MAAAITDDAHHRECVDLLASLHLAGRPILVPGSVAAQVRCLLPAKVARAWSHRSGRGLRVTRPGADAIDDSLHRGGLRLVVWRGFRRWRDRPRKDRMPRVEDALIPDVIRLVVVELADIGRSSARSCFRRSRTG